MKKTGKTNETSKFITFLITVIKMTVMEFLGQHTFLVLFGSILTSLDSKRGASQEKNVVVIVSAVEIYRLLDSTFV